MMRTTVGRFALAAWIGFAVAASGWAQPAAIAILDSTNTKAFFARHYPACNPAAGSFYLGADEYQRYFRGWQWVLQNELGITPAMIQDAEVTETGLAPYNVLILSNTVALSDNESQAISHWVIRGGRLLATFGSGYKDVVTDPHQLDQLKLEKGGTSGLHQLWHDPLSKVFSSLAITPGVDVRITDFRGPTADLEGHLGAGGLLPYGALANLLVQRPPEFPGALGFLAFTQEQWSRPAPAILVSRIGHGQVVYLSFAPEYLVSKEFGLPAPESCPDGQSWSGRSTAVRELMKGTVQYLLAN